ncbi:MAG TPA: aldo/keto reductase [Caulobacteraceae bacterium]|jgi:aryl-alcohol dehydrogenase-like predicted oxidoreductase|nr:aldo/keto reductase [Caulobacteraceae bacterium]
MSIETFELAPGYAISRVIRGGWQLAGGHGAVDEASVESDLLAYFEGGITTFDCADIYNGVEEKYGAFRETVRRRLGAEALSRLKIHTKFVPDLDVLPVIDKAYVRGVIERSLTRLHMERLDLVQFHWWDYAEPRCVETALWLEALRQEGLIDRVAATNFDTPHLEAMVEAGVPLTSLQVQYSLLDDRPAKTMAAACARLGVKLLCYGAIAGGFLSDRWLGAPDPGYDFENRSLVKYRLIIDEFGGWTLFQDLLAALQQIASRQGAGISAVAARWTLDQPQVAGVIVGARDRAHLERTLQIGAVRLTDDDRAALAAVLAQRRGPAGDVYALERDRTGRHGAIMKYNLSQPA